MGGAASNLGAAVDSAEERNVPESVHLLQQFRYITAAIAAHRGADAAPYSNAGLDSASNLLAHISQEVQNFVGSGNLGHLQNAASNADQLLLGMGSWPVIGLKGGAAALANRAFNDSRESAEATISKLVERNLTLTQQAEIEQAKFRDRAAVLENQLSVLQERMTQDQTRLDSALTTMNEASNAKQTEREEKYNEALRRMGNDYQAIADGRLATSFKYLETAKRNFDAVNKLRSDTEVVAGLASADILAGRFAEHSRKQWGWAICSNILGFLVLGLGIFVLVRALQGVGPTDSITWQFAALKLGVTATLVGTAAVAFRLDSRFLGQYTADKGLELELRSIGPFLADVIPAALETAKLAYVNQRFGTRAESQPNSTEVGPELLEIIRTLADSAKSSRNGAP